MIRFKARVEKLLAAADVGIDGDRSWDIQIQNDAFYSRVLRQGSLGLGEAFMDGWWDAVALDQFFYKMLMANLDQQVRGDLRLAAAFLRANVFNPQRKSRAFKIGEHHYDLGNDLFINMLDKRLNYSCGYWAHAVTLDEAQEAKLELICKKLDLQPSMRVLDIGCGWGSFAHYAAEKYHVEVVGITVSRRQVELANQLCQGLPVEIRLQDYREVRETFDHIVSVGMFEHVGHRNYRTFFEMAHRSLKDSGLFLLHTIGGNRSVNSTDPWTAKYIFPNSMLPSIKQIGAAIEGLFVMEDWHNLGAHYDRTLMAWFQNFQSSWGKLKPRYDERFYRMWKYFLLSSAGSFRARRNQLWQIVLSKRGTPGGYQSIR